MLVPLLNMHPELNTSKLAIKPFEKIAERQERKLQVQNQQCSSPIIFNDKFEERFLDAIIENDLLTA